MTVINPREWASTTPPEGHDMPSPFHGDRLKALRTERGWSQAELAEKIGSDARQVSRYENGRVAPSLDVLAKIADTLDISVDYLVIHTAPRRPLHPPENPLTHHTPDPVPPRLAAHEGDPLRHATLRPGGRLADVAPTLLALLGVPKSKDMTGESLIG